jgi:general secretion pathway protein G
MVKRRDKDMEEKGITLLEVIVVIIIVGIFAGILAPLATVTLRRAKITTTKEKLDKLKDALLLYYQDNKSFPTDSGSDPNDLAQLESSTPKYIRSSEYTKDYAYDAWRTPFKYTYNVGAVSCTLRSFGPDRTESTTDDIYYLVASKETWKEWRRMTQDELDIINNAAEEYVRNGGTIGVATTSEDLVSYLPDKSYVYDKWGNTYHYKDIGTFYSWGPDETPSTSDDVYPQGFPTP